MYVSVRPSLVLITIFIIGLCYNVQTVTGQKTFNGSQLLRIFNNNDNSKINAIKSLFDLLQDKYHGEIWLHTKNHTDIFLEKEFLNSAKQQIQESNLKFDVMLSNIQDAINAERQLPKIRGRASIARPKMNWNNYHSHQTIMDFLNEMHSKFPDITELITIGKSIEGRDMRVIKIAASGSENFPKMFIDGGIHAREWISPASNTYCIKTLLESWNTLPAHMRNKIWYFLPVYNPDGYEYSRNVDRMWRKNRRINENPSCPGVDLNRNFDIQWHCKYQEHDEECDQTYPGTGPFSEPESKAVSDFLKNNKKNMKAYLTMHSYGQYILYPYGYDNSRVSDEKRLLEIGKLASKNALSVNSRDAYNVEQSILLGNICGATDDWTKAVLGIKYSYTVELRDQGKYGFILPTNLIEPTGKEAFQIISTFSEAISKDK